MVRTRATENGRDVRHLTRAELTEFVYALELNAEHMAELAAPANMPGPRSITCPECGATSCHPEDVRQGYCGRCHWWTSDHGSCSVAEKV